MTTREVALFERYASCAAPLPCSAPLSVGRTIYSRTRENSTLARRGILGIKSKGVQALDAGPDSTFRQVWPSPDQPYSTVPTPHMWLDEALRLRTVAGGLKALNSLSEQGATNEYLFHQALASVDAGLPPLLAVRFGTDDAPEFDCFDGGTGTRRTGGVFLGHDPDSVTVAAHAHFVWHPGAPEGDRDLEDLLAHFLATYERVARVNARALLQAGVARHSSVATNFLINPSSERVLQTDLDSCIPLDAVPETRRGPQILRDVSSALVKMTTQLCLGALSQDLMTLLSSSRPRNLFHGPLEAYFGSFASEGDIAEAAAQLQRRLIGYLTDRRALLAGERARYVMAVAAADRETAAYHEEGFTFIMLPFLKDCILELYHLLKDSGLTRAGYPLPAIAGASLNARLFEGLKEYRRALMKSTWL